MTDATALQGHNAPPTDADPLRERLLEDHAGLIARRDALIDALGRVPETIEDDETAGKVADYVKQIHACLKALEGARVAEKEPFLAAGRTVDGLFKTTAEPLEKTKRLVEAKLTTYQRQKAEAERRAREEAERKAREEADRARREAEERAAALQAEEDLPAAVAAEEAALQAQADARRAERAADAKPAELSRTRSEAGSVASLHTFWDFADLDRESLDLEPLRFHLPQAALEGAVRSFIRAGGRELRGVRIFENTQTRVR